MQRCMGTNSNASFNHVKIYFRFGVTEYGARGISILKAEATHFIYTRDVGIERRAADSYVILYLEVRTGHICLPMDCDTFVCGHICTFIFQLLNQKIFTIRYSAILLEL